MTILASGYTIGISQAEITIIGLATLLTILAWAFGALLKASLGLNRWFGLLMFVPIVNVLAFIAAGVAVHYRTIEQRDMASYEKIKRLIEEGSTAEAVQIEAD